MPLMFSLSPCFPVWLNLMSTLMWLNSSLPGPLPWGSSQMITIPLSKGNAPAAANKEGRNPVWTKSRLCGWDIKCAYPRTAPVSLQEGQQFKHHLLWTKTVALSPWQQAQVGTVGVIPYTKPSLPPPHAWLATHFLATASLSPWRLWLLKV